MSVLHNMAFSRRCVRIGALSQLQSRRMGSSPAARRASRSTFLRFGNVLNELCFLYTLRAAMRFGLLSVVYGFALLSIHIQFIAALTASDGSRSNSRRISNSSNQTGLQAALACWQQWDDFSTASTNCPKTTITVSTTTWTNRVTSTIQETFKLCDDHPRAVATGGERTSTSLGEMSGTPYTTYTMVFPPSGVPVATETTQLTTTTTFVETSCVTEVPTPTCSIGNEECKALFSSWTAGSYERSRPPCTYALPKDPCDDCWIYVPSVKLIYFPVSMTGDLCGSCRLHPMSMLRVRD